MNDIVQAVEDIWVGDLLGRKAEGAYLRRYIERLYDADKKDQTSFVLNINSEWGHGKTWFLKNLSRELRQNHPVVYFDAWKNDFSNDALLSFVSVVCDELSKLFWKDKPISQKIIKVKSIFSSLSKSALPILLSVLAKQLTGKALDDLGLSDKVKDAFVDASDEFSKVVSASAIDSFLTQRNAISDFSNAIQSLVEEIRKKPSIKLPICIMVDELDRCRPTYAIELLEAIKHLFSINGVFFILATDTRQLGHSIKAVYGERFNSHAYLKRFFYAEYQLAEPNYQNMADYLFSYASFSERLFVPEPLNKDYGLKGFFSKTAEFFRLTTRDQEQVFAILEAISLTTDKKDIHFIFLLFLVCIKHKFGELAETVFVHRNSTKLNEFFSEIILEIKNVKIESIKDDDEFLGQRVDLSIREIFEHYFKLLGTNLNAAMFSKEDSFHYKENIRRKLFEGKTRNSRTGKYEGSHDLNNYFDLLSQAGRISVR